MAKEILLLGEFSTGKSAFINMMLGVSILPERLDSTNLPVIKIFSGEAAGLWLREAGQKYPRHLTRWQDIPTNWTEFEFGEITIPEHPLLKSDIIFWDTPGINSTNKHHEEHLQKFLTAKSGDIDLILFFVNKNITKTSLDFLNKWKDFKEKIYIIQNFRDTVNEKELRLLNDDMKLTVYTKYKNVPVEYLYIADICDEFNDRSEEKKDGLTEWDILHKWSERKIDITKLNGHTLEKTNWSFIQNLVTKSKCIDKVPLVASRNDNVRITRDNVGARIESNEDIKNAFRQGVLAYKAIKESNKEINSFEPEMVFVEGGAFMMGDDSVVLDEKPIHKVSLTSFYIGKIPVTQELWNEGLGILPSHFVGNNLPVESVSWRDVQQFLGRLNEKTGKKYRLPTEAEWEYAARGGVNSKGYKYSGGNNIYEVGWFIANADNKTHAVGKKSPNELGIHDMCGNVYEWCSDWYDTNYYKESPSNNPKGPTSQKSYRIVRGGSWNCEIFKCRTAYRASATPNNCKNTIGFRLAMDA